MTLLAQHADAEVHHASWQALAEVVRERGGCDALIVDAPYSERTHAGHDRGVDLAGVDIYRGTASKRTPAMSRRELDYAAWGAADVDAFVATWAPLVSGWMVSLTDHALAPEWQRAMEEAGRYAFAPIACVEPGSRIRLVGDGPSNWSCWAVVSRPRDGAWLTQWRFDRRAVSSTTSLPGAYVVPPGHGEAQTRGEHVVGGKPLWLMERLVEDYSRPGNLVVDPCCGAGTTLVAAQRTGRKSIGGDVLREHADLAAKRISRPAQQPLFAAGGRS